MHSCALPLSFHARLILKSPSEDSRGYFCQQLADQIFGWGQHWDSGWWRGGGGWSWLPSWEGCQPLRGRDTSTFFAMHWSCSIAGEKRHNTYHSHPSLTPLLAWMTGQGHYQGIIYSTTDGSRHITTVDAMQQYQVLDTVIWALFTSRYMCVVTTTGGVHCPLVRHQYTAYRAVSQAQGSITSTGQCQFHG